jgi:hypothetical protein
MSSGDNNTAISLIQQSIDTEWMGFFPLKTTAAAVIPGEDIFDRERRLLKEARLRSEARDAAEKSKIITNGN